MKPGLFDYVLLAVIPIAAIFEWRWYWPRYVESIRANVSGARARMYRNLVITEWLVTLYVLGLWVLKGRAWSALWLESAAHLRLALGFLFAAIVIAVLWLNTRAILARPKAVARVREKIGYIEPLVPCGNGERRAFWFVAITAGTCEEVIFRGFVMWCFSVWVGLIPAILITSILFGFGHIYQGISHVIPTGLAGLLLALVVVATGSLWPAIIIHAAMDLNSGELGFRTRQTSFAPASSPSSATS